MSIGPEVSVIVPCYNTGLYLENCLNSIFNQSFTDFEVIAINDGSTDNTKDVLEKFKRGFDSLSVYDQSNSGASSARNLGIRMARGKFVVFVDSDDFINKDYLATLYQSINLNSCDLASCAYIDIFLKKHTIQSNYEYSGKIKADNFIPYLFENIGGVLWDKIYRIKIIREFNIQFTESISISEDLLFNLDYLKYANNIFIINKPLYNYNRNNTIGLSRTFDLNTILNHLKLNHIVKNKLTDHSFPDSKINFILNRMLFTQKKQILRNIHNFPFSNHSRVLILKFLKLKFSNREKPTNFYDSFLNLLLKFNQYRLCIYIGQFIAYEKNIFRHIFSK
jgi:glycosyltransferase involved in cell wall biosynthesis